MSQQWYILKDGVTSGPYSFDQLRQMSNTGSLNPEDMVWSEGMADYVPAWQVQGILGGGPAIQAGHYGQAAPKGKGLLVALIVILVAIAGLSTFIGLQLFGGNNDDVPYTAEQQSDPLSYLGYWKGEMEGLSVYMMFEPGEKAAFIMPQLNQYNEDQYYGKKNNGAYTLAFYDHAALHWVELLDIEIVDQNSITITDLRSGSPTNYTRIDEQEYNAAVSSIKDLDPYLVYRARIQTDLLSSFLVLEELINNPRYNAEWDNQLLVTMSLIIAICAEIYDSSAPEQYYHSHQYLQYAAEYFFDAMSDIQDGFYESAKENMTMGQWYLEESKRYLN